MLEALVTGGEAVLGTDGESGVNVCAARWCGRVVCEMGSAGVFVSERFI